MKFKLILMSLLFVPLIACTSKSDDSGEKLNFKIGATVGDFAEITHRFLKPALEKKGYKISVVEFTDYVQPNLALAEKSLDLNIFQHLPYLQQFVALKNLKLSEVDQIPTAPLGLYAGKTKSLEEAKTGLSVAIPNDPTNLARALVILSNVGWITLKEGADEFKASVNDIKDNSKKIKIVQLEAAQIPRSLQDVDFAVINGNYVISSGLKLTSALATEEGDKYVNWAVARTEDLNSKFITDVKEALNSIEFQNYSKDRFKGYKFPTKWQK